MNHRRCVFFMYHWNRIMKPVSFILAVSCSMLMWLSSVSGAQLVYFQENGVGGQPRGLYNFDTTTGLSSQRAAVGGTERFFGMDARLSDAALFAVNYVDNGSMSGLYRINIDTGATSLIGSMGVDMMVGLAFNPLNGDLYSLRHAGGLYRVNVLTGAAAF